MFATLSEIPGRAFLLISSFRSLPIQFPERPRRSFESLFEVSGSFAAFSVYGLQAQENSDDEVILRSLRST